MTVQLSSSDTTGLTVPATVTIPAGQTSASFNVTMVDDHVIEGNRPISVTAQMDNWTPGSATMTDFDRRRHVGRDACRPRAGRGRRSPAPAR